MRRKAKRRSCRPIVGSAVAAALASAASLSSIVAPARAVEGIYVSNGTVVNATYVNQSVEANALYGSFAAKPIINGSPQSFSFGGDYGGGAVLSVIDLGYVDNTNTGFTSNPVTTFFGDTASSNPSSPPPSQYVGDHATAVAMFAAGEGPIDATGMTPNYQLGIAAGATIWSGAVISSGDPNSTATDGYLTTNSSFIDPFVQAMQTGINGVKTDVINVSVGDPTDLVGDNFTTVALDGLIAQNHTTVVVAAGNAGPDGDTVGSPASGYNGISVGATAADSSLTYSSVVYFSSRGPNDFYNPYTKITTPGVRAAVDLVAPGDEFIISSDSKQITYGSGTSYAAPLVAGAATQLSALAHVVATYFPQPGADANDGRVLKAILMNSADKLPGWNNGQAMTNGVLTTTQALDYTQGAGQLNVARAEDNYLDGQFDPKVVGNSSPNLGPKGWDLSTVTKGTDNLYDLGQITAGTTLTTTLAWFVDRTYDSSTQTAGEGSFANLNLDLYEVVAGSDKLIAVSAAPYENVQQLSFALPASSDYVVGVDFAGIAYGPSDGSTPNSETYALAWSDVPVPEPTMLTIVVMGAAMLRRRRQLFKKR
jgi:hypothetical protein